MKKLWILAAAAMLVGSAAGCRWCERMWRGEYNPCPTTIMAPAPTVMAAPDCNACAAPAMVYPGPGQ
ncbi:MAG: hypothetical protein ACOY3P_13775 [Planctomycetota bacterium]